jgi:MFS transporter, DHA1 family, inner membrane transport protein
MNRSLLFLFSAVNLVIGTGAFIITSILPQLAQGLGISVPAAGQAMTAYAISTAVLAPLALAFTGSWPRRKALVFAMLLFAAGNVVCALASSLPMLMLGRVLMGVGAMFTPIAAGIVVALAPPAERGKSLALVFLGISVSYVVGLPLGSVLTAQYGWHAPIAVVAVAALLMAAALWLRVPAAVQAPGGSFKGLGALLSRADVMSVLAVTLLYFIAIFTVFSYIVPVLQALAPMPAGQLSFTLMLFGLSGVAGTLIGGYANDRFGPMASLTVLLSLLGSTMLLLPLTQGQWWLMVAVFVVWGTSGFGMMASQQSRLALLAPAQAPVLLSLNTSMLYLGTALGAVLGGAASPLVGFAKLSWVAAPAAALALLLLRFGPRAGAAKPA